MVGWCMDGDASCVVKGEWHCVEDNEGGLAVVA